MKSKKLTALILTAGILVSTSLFSFQVKASTVAPASIYNIVYEGHVQNIGWQPSVSTNGDQTIINDTKLAGTSGKSLRVEALRISSTNLPKGASITYQGHVQNIGWQKSVTENGNIDILKAPLAGTSGQSLRVEAFKMTLNGLPGYAIQYRVHVQNIGWQKVAETINDTPIDNATLAGTSGKSLRMEAIQIEIVKTDAEKIAEVNTINKLAMAVTSKSAIDISSANTLVQSVKDVAQKAYLTAKIAAITDSSIVIPADPSKPNDIPPVVTPPVITPPVVVLPVGTYMAPLPNSNFYNITPFSALPNKVNILATEEYIVKGENNQYVSPNDTNSVASLQNINEYSTIYAPSANLSEVLDINMHSGYLASSSGALFGSTQGRYLEGVFTFDIAKLATMGHISGGNNTSPYTKVVGVYTESIDINSNDVTKLTNAARTLGTQFMEKSEYDVNSIYENYAVVYNSIKKTNTIVRYVVYSKVVAKPDNY